MRKELHIFVDPKTQRPLDLKVEKIKGAHIVSGILCNRENSYPIVKGIPRFVEKSFYNVLPANTKEKQTAESFGYKWREKRNRRLGSVVQDAKGLKEQFMAVLGCQTTAQLQSLLRKAKRTLNAGCGVAWSEYLFNYHQNIERHSIDISLSVEVAYNNTKKFKNVIVSQASIFELPYLDETFDIIYSIGVLHHTPNSKEAFLYLARKLKPGGLMGIYIYNIKPFLREIADKEIRQVTRKMSYDVCMRFSKKMTKLGKALSKIEQPLIIEEDIDLLGIKKGKYNIHSFIYNYFLKCWYNHKWDVKYADLVNQDWYHPHYARHHTKDEIINWFKKAGIKSIKCMQPKGWEYSGYFLSGRKE